MNKAFTREPDDADDNESSALPAIPAGTKNYMTPAGYRHLKEEYLHLLDVERPALVQTVAWAASNGDRSENGDYIYGKKRLREIDRRLRFLAKRLESSEVIDPAQRRGCDQVFFGATVTVRSLPQSADRNPHLNPLPEGEEAVALSPTGGKLDRGLVGNVSEVRSRRGGAKPSGSGASASHLLDETTSHSTRLQETAAKSLVIPQSADSVGNVSEVRTYSIVGIDEANAGKGHISWVSPLARTLLKARADDVVRLQLPNGFEELIVVEVVYQAIE